jgi:hypothetical protein
LPVIFQGFVFVTAGRRNLQFRSGILNENPGRATTSEENVEEMQHAI